MDLDLFRRCAMYRIYVLKLCLSSKHLLDVGVQLGFAHRPVAPGIRANIDVQHRNALALIVPQVPPGVVDVAAQMDMNAARIALVGSDCRNADIFKPRIRGWIMRNGADVSSDLRSNRPANRPHVVVRIVVALQEHYLALDLREIEVRLVASGLRPTVLAVVHEVADVNEQIVRLAALVDPANQRSIVLGHALERAVRPVDDPRILGALEVEVAGKEGFHCGCFVCSLDYIKLLPLCQWFFTKTVRNVRGQCS